MKWFWLFMAICGLIVGIAKAADGESPTAEFAFSIASAAIGRTYF